MKKFILSFFVIGCFALYAIYYGSGGKLIYVATPKTTALVKNKNTTSVKIVKNSLKNGEFIGNKVDAYYGYIQVKAVIANGKLADVVFLDYPQDRGNSIRINNYAMPILKSEAIKAQSSNVNTVSGATDSSGAFNESLASALAQAKI